MTSPRPILCPLQHRYFLFKLRASPSGGFITTVLAVSISTTQGGYMKYLTYTKSPTGATSYKFSNLWHPDAYALAPAASTAVGYSVESEGAKRALFLDSAGTLRCAVGRLPNSNAPTYQDETILTWSPCPYNLPPSPSPIRSLAGVQKPDGSETLIARREDNRVQVISKAAFGGWGAWSVRDDRIFGRPSLVASQGASWANLQGPDRRVALWKLP